MDPIGEALLSMMRYSEIPRELSSESLRYSEKYTPADDQYYRNLRDDSPQSDISANSGAAIGYSMISNGKHSNKHHVVGDGESKVSGSAKKTAKIRIKKNSISSLSSAEMPQATLTGYNNYGLGVTPPSNNSKSQSLPPNSSMLCLDPVIISALRLAPEELASQITLLDMPVFQGIPPDELTSCAWTKKNKYIITPNIVAFTKRFNHTSFWTVQEVLNGSTPKERAEIIAHFIKVGKKLHDLNNLHSLFAITSALKSASVHRLAKSWSHLSKKDRQTFEKLADIFKEDSNWSSLREVIDSLKLPCIPYLGVFLTDLVYIDLAHPDKGGLEPEQRKLKMNNILRVISIYQNSDYGHLPVIPKVKKYLQNIRFIEELQNIFEDEQYKKSLKLEPQQPNINSQQAHSSSSCSSKESVLPSTNMCTIESGLASLNVSPAKSSSMRLNTNNNTPSSKFSLGHRKTQSLGSKFRSASLPRNFHQNCHNCNTSTQLLIMSGGKGAPGRCSTCRIFHKLTHQAATIQRNDSFHHSRHLLDDSVLEDQQPSSLQVQLQQSDAISTGSSEGIIGYDGDCISESSMINNLDSPNESNFQGCVRRKTLLKDGRKPAVASWQRYWLQIWANSLVYFPPKSFKGSERSDYKREPCKVCNLDGWTVELTENSSQTNTFQLINSSIGCIYKFRSSSHDLTILWLKQLQRATKHYVEKPLPANLMSFE